MRGVTLEQFQSAVKAHYIMSQGAPVLPQDLPQFIQKTGELAAKRSQRRRRLAHDKMFGR